MKPTIRYIPPETTEAIWQYIEPWLVKSLRYSYNKLTINDLKQQCLLEEAQLWLVFDNESEKTVAVFVTFIETYPQSSWLNIGFLGGERCLHLYTKVMEELEEFSKAVGCQGILIKGRDGWGRLLKMKKSYTVFEKSF